METSEIKFTPYTEKYTILRSVSHAAKDRDRDHVSKIEFIEYYETNPGESLSQMIKRRKIKNIDRVFKGHIEEVEDFKRIK